MPPFCKGIAHVEADTYTLPVQIGVLPPLLESALLVSGRSGIIGTELFKLFSACLDYPGSTMHFSKLR